MPLNMQFILITASRYALHHRLILLYHKCIPIFRGPIMSSSELRRGGPVRERVLLTRAAEIEDVREINFAIQNTGGPGFYKAMFSAYHVPTLLDTSYMSYVSRIEGHETEDNPNLVEGFVTINDSIPLMSDPQSYEKVINALKNFIPITVKQTISLTILWNIFAINELVLSF